MHKIDTKKELGKMKATIKQKGSGGKMNRIRSSSREKRIVGQAHHHRGRSARCC